MAKPLKSNLFRKLASLYARMEKQYNEHAQELDLSCQGCQDNCCTSFFQHHTYIEWLYLLKGLRSLPEGEQQEILDKAREYVAEAREAMTRGERPQVMCPANKDGLCQLYSHRLMICRMHGVPNSITLPNGNEQHFPGCKKCQNICKDLENVPILDRTELYKELATLEMQLLGKKIQRLPRVDLTLAEMLVQGDPSL